MVSSIIQALSLLRFSSIWVSKKGNDKEPMICLTPKLSQSFFVYRIQNKEIFFLLKKSFLRKGRSWVLNKKQKEGFLTVLTTAIKKDPTTSIRKCANELKVYEKIVRTAIKQDLSPDFNPLDYAIWGVLENKTNETSHPNFGSLNTAIQEEWNKMSGEFILKVCKPFRRCVDIIIE